MRPTYLYVKTHRITGMKYFGKTTKSDPMKYNGSGIYWKKHLAKYGYEIDTEILGLFIDEQECIDFAVDFSIKNKITESNEWANLKDENGLDGSPVGVKFTEEHKEKIRQSRYGKCFNPFTEKTREKMSAAAKIKIKKQIEEGKSAFQGEQGSKLAKERNKRLSAEGKHNFQQTGWVSAVDPQGITRRITKEQYWTQTGNKETWEFVNQSTAEAKRRKGARK